MQEGELTDRKGERHGQRQRQNQRPGGGGTQAGRGSLCVAGKALQKTGLSTQWDFTVDTVWSCSLHRCPEWAGGLPSATQHVRGNSENGIRPLAGLTNAVSRNHSVCFVLTRGCA